ncbi:MAG: prolipoprotein diacylglyceryl transferase [Patiriisocius sp.]|uniref:prolipoprotein diacylglyceryl transferase n=1 Tax=Patiriisocius sp. TaxID=2822396 RepID=UPI003EF281FF
MRALTILWNPSEGIDLGFFEIKFYSLMFVVAFVLGWFLIKRIFAHENESEKNLDSLFIYMVIAILVGARMGHVIFYQSELLLEDPLSVFLPFSFVPEIEYTGFRGLASHGAAIGVIIAMYFYSKKVLKKPMLWILDRVVLTVACGAIFVRIGNFINSEIIGKPSGDFPLGVQFLHDEISPNRASAITGIKDSGKAYDAIANDPTFADALASVPFRHAAQLYESVGYVFVFAILMWLYWKTDKSKQLGFLFGTFLVLLWTVRFFVEFVKEAQVGERADWALNTGQLLSIPFILIGIYFMVTSYKKKYENSPNA